MIIMKFNPGKLVATSNALTKITNEDIVPALDRHMRGDWGDVCEEDRKLNDEALVNGSRLLSVYHSDSGTKFWIITEADRSVTTVLLPEDY